MENTHKTIGRKEGDRYIYECPICDYRIEFIEAPGLRGQMIKTEGDPVAHYGIYVSPLAVDVNEN